MAKIFKQKTKSNRLYLLNNVQVLIFLKLFIPTNSKIKYKIKQKKHSKASLFFLF